MLNVLLGQSVGSFKQIKKYANQITLSNNILQHFNTEILNDFSTTVLQKFLMHLRKYNVKQRA